MMRIHTIKRYPVRYLVLGIVFIIFGLLLIFCLANSKEKHWKQCTDEVYGKAVGITRTSRPRGGFNYDFTLEFEVAGRKYTEKCTSSSEVKEGESMRVLYDPDDPTVYVVPVIEASPLMTRMTGGVLILIGLVISVKALSVMAKSKT